MTRRAEHFYDFGPFRLDAAGRLLLRDGAPVALTSKAFEVLLVLVRNSGQLVETEELMKSVWPDAFVETANLTQHIFTLRKALGEGSGSRLIVTVPRRGYRLDAEVKEVRAEGHGPAGGHHRDTPSGGGADETSDRTQPLDSLAVLPFVNAGADPHADYLSDGLTESIINNLSQLPRLRVVNRSTVFRYKGNDDDPRAVGRELGVLAVLAGRVLQLGDRLIVRTELIDVTNGWQLWGEQYHRRLVDILVVQEEISEEISERLRIKLTGRERKQLNRRPTENTEAYQLYLKGRYHWNKYANEGLKRGIEYFRRAIEADPTYALAYAGLADSYYRLSNLHWPPKEAMPKAKAAALQALEIDETLAEAHAALGLIKMVYDWDWEGAEDALTRAVELKPGYAIAHQRLGLYYNFRGRFDEAGDELQRALELDPLSLQVYQGAAVSFFLTHRYGQAIKLLQKALDMDANYLPALYLLGWVHVQTGEYQEAVAEFQKIRESDDGPLFLAALGYVYALTGEQGEARKILSELDERSKHRYVSSYSRAVIHAGLKEKEEAFAWLERAYEERSEMLAWLKVGPELDGLRSDVRFGDLLRRVGLHRDRRAARRRCLYRLV